MSIPTQIPGHQQKYLGLFAVKGRLFNKIISKQIDVVQNLEYNLKHKVIFINIYLELFRDKNR